MSHDEPVQGMLETMGPRQHDWRDIPGDPSHKRCDACGAVAPSGILPSPPCLPRNRTHTRESW